MARTYTVYRATDDKVVDVIDNVNQVYTQDGLFKFHLTTSGGSYGKNYASAMYPSKLFYIRVDKDL